MNEAAKFARAVTLKQIGFLATESAFAAYVDMPGEKSFVEDINWNIAKARRENQSMSLGEVPVPAAFDDHSVHIEEHNRYRSSADYENLPEEQRQVVDMHVQAHSTLAAEEAAEQLMKQMYGDPSLAMAAQAGQPPGSMRPESPQQGEQTMANNSPRPEGIVNPPESPGEPPSPTPPFS